jgi:hypothetical protein
MRTSVIACRPSKSRTLAFPKIVRTFTSRIHLFRGIPAATNDQADLSKLADHKCGEFRGMDWSGLLVAGSRVRRCNTKRRDPTSRRCSRSLMHENDFVVLPQMLSYVLLQYHCRWNQSLHAAKAERCDAANVGYSSPAGSTWSDTCSAMRESGRTRVPCVSRRLPGGKFSMESERSRLQAAEIARDTLKRHLTIHGPAAVQAFSAPRKTSRACHECAKAKQRCDALVPCERCVTRSLVCTVREDTASEAPAAPLQTEMHNEEASQSATDSGASLQSESLPTPDFVALLGNDPSIFDDLFDAIPNPDRILDFAFPSNDPANLVDEWNIDQNLDEWFAAGPLPGKAKHDTSASAPSSRLTSTQDLGRAANSTCENTSIQNTSLDLNLTTLDDDDLLDAERLHLVPPVSEAVYDKIATCHSIHASQNGSTPVLGILPDRNAMDVFVQLYFEHYHARVPLLHAPTFKCTENNWMLVMVLGAIGCQFSNVSARNEYDRCLVGLISRAVLQQVSSILEVSPSHMGANQSFCPRAWLTRTWIRWLWRRLFYSATFFLCSELGKR